MLDDENVTGREACPYMKGGRLMPAIAYFEESVWTHGMGDVRPGDFTGDAGRFGRNSTSGRLKPKRRAEYVGTAQNPCPRSVSEHVVPGVNVDKPRGAFSVLVDAVKDGRVSLSSLDEKTARRVARILYP